MDDTARKTATDNEKYRHSFVGVKGDLRVELHYIKVQGFGDDRQAALYIHKFNNYDGGVYLAFSDLWRYADPALSKEGIPGLVKTIAKHIYGIENHFDEVRVFDAIFDYAQDLKDHKPPPGVDKTMDEFLEECDNEDLEFFIEDGMGNRITIN